MRSARLIFAILLLRTANRIATVAGGIIEAEERRL